MADSIEHAASSGGTAGDSTDSALEYTTTADDRPVSLVVVELVASLRGEDPIELEPLYETVDPDALESVLESFSGGRGAVSFTYLGYAVTVADDGTVAVAPADE